MSLRRIKMAKRGRRYGAPERNGWTKATTHRMPGVAPGKKSKSKSYKYYTVIYGTWCWIRPLGTKKWKKYLTTKTTRFCGYSWRNKTHHGLVYGGWEMKVENQNVTGSDE